MPINIHASIVTDIIFQFNLESVERLGGSWVMTFYVLPNVTFAAQSLKIGSDRLEKLALEKARELSVDLSGLPQHKFTHEDFLYPGPYIRTYTPAPEFNVSEVWRNWDLKPKVSQMW